MKEKFISLNSLLFLFVLLASCQSKEKFDWDAGISGPKHYPSGAPSVSYFYKGEDLAGASSGTGADQGWGITSGGFTGGDDLKPVPDSVYVKWVCGADDLLYKAGFKLPREKMLELFKKGTTDLLGKRNDYTVIIAGMAPGGNVCIWMQAGTVLTEVAKFKVKKGTEDPNIDKSYRQKDIKGWEDYLTYWELHGIPYHVWEVGEKEYNYTIGFSSAEDKNYSFGITGYSKDGTTIGYNQEDTTLVMLKQNANYTPSSSKIKNKLPVHFSIQWISEDDEQWYKAEIVLPNNFSEKFTSSGAVKNYGYDRILIKMDKEIPGQAYVFGKVMILGKDKEDIIMKFRAPKLNNKTKAYSFSKYSLPKGYVFPKWEGRNTLTFPKLDYWQEP
ncbi:DUF2931 family protein [Pedobacter psychrodurus]|uniref:DUF2931 family protein n=1 Tax=Pedobacter psychrodurus TaxID=2530456 RepID=UPI00293072C3|nr:DUF2931 family protein [Pedobacter psychrodurus]